MPARSLAPPAPPAPPEDEDEDEDEDLRWVAFGKAAFWAVLVL
jgi:hypothetical protein